VDDPFGIPWLVIVALALIPVAGSALFGIAAFRGMTPLVFRCRRCQRDFTQPAHRAFPTTCPHCRAQDWNAD
jgi:Zn finger protein HypA/HybF involved in hydrogenase expression